MKYGHHAICINPNSMMMPVGYIERQNPISTTKGDLYARAFYIEDSEKLCFITLDSLGVCTSVQKLFETTVKEILGSDVTLILSSSHTHYAPSLTQALGYIKTNDSYVKFVQSRLRALLMNMKIRDAHLSVDCNQMNQTLIGRSRISGNNDDYVILHLLRFYDQNQRIGNFIIYNCHPTISDAQVAHFTSDYVGVTLETLSKNHPGEFFMFFQGPAGDISTRFTRKNRSYEEVIRMGRLLGDSVNAMMKHAPKPKELKLSRKRLDYTIEGKLKSSDSFVISAQASDREISEFENAKNIVKDMSSYPQLLHQQITIDIIQMGLSTLIFNPFELFSSYSRYLPVNGVLIGYSQGYAGYMSDIDSAYASYETLLEIYSEQDKQKLIDIIRSK
jgi:neutral ceramidase